MGIKGGKLGQAIGQPGKIGLFTLTFGFNFFL